MSRRRLVVALVGLVVLATVALVVAGAAAFSAASYTTSSQTDVTASTDTASNWLQVYSQGSDPDFSTGYARRRGINGVWGLPAATGQDERLVVDMGDFPDKKVTVAFPRTFSIKTSPAFPDASVTQITVAMSVLPDPASDEDILIDQSLTRFGQTTGGVQTVTLGPGAKYQLNVSVRARKRFTLGQTYYPRVVLAITVAGVANYYRYEFPLEVTDAGGS